MTGPATPHAEDSMEGPVGPGRARLPDERRSRTTKLKVGGFGLYVTAGEYPDGRLGEIFVKGAGKEGSTTQGLLDAFATCFSIALQYGAEFPMLVRKFHHMKFEPQGFTDHPGLGECRSLIDALMKWLVLHYGDEELRREVGTRQE